MPEVTLSRSDLALVDAGIRALQVSRGEGGDDARQALDRILGRGVDLRVAPSAEAVVVEVESEGWVEVAEAVVAVAGAGLAVYQAFAAGIEFEDRLREHLTFEPQASLDELIEARHAMERTLFEAGA